MIGGYVRGRTWLHRTPAWTKLIGLLTVVTVLGFWPRTGTPPRWAATLVALGLVVVLAMSARLPLGRALRAIRPVLLLAVLLAAVQVLVNGPARAAEVVGQLLVAVTLGQVLLMTTRVAEMVRVIARTLIPLRRWRSRRARFELLLGLTIGSIPVVAGAWRIAREAAAARGVRPRLRVVVPSVLVAILRRAEALGEAMIARGL